MAYGYGQMRSSDRDRDTAHAMLQAAYADGRLNREEFDDRSARLLSSQTHGELQSLTADLPGRLPFVPVAPVPYGQYPVMPQPRTNSMAVGALVCGDRAALLPVPGVGRRGRARPHLPQPDQADR